MQERVLDFSQYFKSFFQSVSQLNAQKLSRMKCANESDATNQGRRRMPLAALFLIVLFTLQWIPSHSFSIPVERSLIKNNQRSFPFGSSGIHQSRQRHAKLCSVANSVDELNDADVERLSRLHTVLRKLQSQIPLILTTPLTESSAEAVYDDNIQLVVEDNILASSREELVSLSTTLVLGIAATNTATSFLTSAASRAAARPAESSSSPQEPSTMTSLKSQMALDPSSLQSIRVQWQVHLPGYGNGELQGVSELKLDETTGKVTTLRLLQVKWNDERLNARAIAESLASTRALVLGFQNSPVIKSFLPASVVPSLASLLGGGFVEQLTRQSSPDGAAPGGSEPTPLFVADSLDTAFMYTPRTNFTDRFNKTNATATTASMATLIPIDEYVANRCSSNTTSILPLPGSKSWDKYVASRSLVQFFIENTLPILSGNKTVPSREMVELFSQQAKLIAEDGSELLQGRDQVGNYFQTLASFRKRSSGSWQLIKSSIVRWSWNAVTDIDSGSKEDSLTIAVKYRATFPLPGSAAPVVIDGLDHFVLDLTKLPDRISGINDETEEGDVEIVIQRVEQRKLKIGGVGNRPPDGLFFMKSLVSALDAGKFTSVGGDSVVMDLLQKAIAGDISADGRVSTTGEDKVASKRRKRVPPKLPEPVAARVYNIMASLYEDVPSMVAKENLRVYQLPPLHEFMNEKVELRGYLGETLFRGFPAYNRAIGAIFSSLKGALVTGSAKLEKEPAVNVELTAEGHVRLSFTVDLRVLPLPSVTSELISSMSGSAIKLPQGGFPLEITAVSEYVIDKETGDIYQHRLIESRINGQLTPADFVSRWLKQIASKNSDKNTSNEQGLLDVISWVRTMSKRS